MRILVTCGPGYEPIDDARRITNFSTGALGIRMANYFVESGHQVICLKAEGSTSCHPCHAQQTLRFGTNGDLARLLQEISVREPINAILHAAALSDYRVAQVLSASGEILSSPKFATQDGHLHLALAPAIKVLPQIRSWFPESRIVGWKYELAGSRDDAFAKAWQQLRTCATDACVLNGNAYGAGFALCCADGRVVPCKDRETLCEALDQFLAPKNEVA